MNPVPPAQGDDGKATPPPVAGFPPKYTQAHFEEVRNITISFSLHLYVYNHYFCLCIMHVIKILYFNAKM